MNAASEISDERKAVFLSYASQDEEAARRICDALRAAGVEVWFDQSELRGGDAWDAKIRKQIKECALFVPVISANTQARLEGYFRLEWKLAEDRSHLMARGKPFIVPVTIDATTDHEAHVPDSFLAVQWTRLPGGTTTSGFADRVSALLRGPSLATESARPVQGDDRRPLPRKARRRQWWGVVTLGGVIAIGALMAFAPWRSGGVRKDTAGPTVTFPEAHKLARQARALIDDDLLAIRENYRLAEELCRKAVAMDVADAEAWATWARVSAGMIERNYDASASRRAALRTQAERAIRLDPESVEAGLAIAAQLATSGSADEAETRLRALLAKAPQDPRVPLALARALRQTGKAVEATELRLNHPAFGRRDPRPLVEEARAIAFASPAEAAALVDRAQAMAPSLDGYNLELMLAVQVGGDLEAGRALVKTIPARIQQEDVIAAYTARLWLWAGEGDMALAALRRCPNEFLEEGRNFGFTPKGNLAGWAHQISGRTAAAKAEWTQALAVVEKRIVAEPERADFLRWKAQLLALLSLTSEADKAWQLYTEMAGRNGVPLLHEAEFQVAMGRKEEAINRVRAVAATEWGPHFYAYGLRYNPWFAAVRNDPRVQGLIAEGQAKVAAEQGVAITGTQGASLSRNPNPNPKSIAVLPFANLSTEKENEFFADGMQDDVITNLAKIRDLTVISRTSTLAYRDTAARNLKKIAADLGVATILEGSVRRVGIKVHMNAQLIDAHTDAHLWADTFNGDASDPFALQADVAQKIAAALKATLTPGERTLIARRPTTNQEAYDLYTRARLRAQVLSTIAVRADYEPIVSLYEQAIAKDPAFALAFAQLSGIHGLMYWFGGVDPTPERRARAEAALAAARKLAPDAPETHFAQGEFAYRCNRDWKGALAEFALAEQGMPKDAQLQIGFGNAYRRLAQLPEAAARYERAIALNPLELNACIALVQTLSALRRYAETRACAGRYLAVFPGDWGLKALRIRAQFALDGDYAAFVRANADLGPTPDDSAGLQFAYRSAMLAGHLAEAERILANSRQSRLDAGSNFSVAIARPAPPFDLLLHRGLVAFLLEKREAAAQFAAQASELFRGKPPMPEKGGVPMAIAQLEAFAGRTEAALRDGRAALELWHAVDEFAALTGELQFATIQLILDRRDDALGTLRHVMSLPGASPSDVRHDPLWSRLRNDPRFEEILKSAKTF